MTVSPDAPPEVGPLVTPPTSTPWVPVWGGQPLSYDGDWVAGLTYQDGQIVVKDGMVYLCAGGPTTAAPDPAPWGAARPTKESELAYVELAANSPSIGTGGITVLTCPPVNCDGVTPLVASFHVPTAQLPAGIGSSLWADLLQDGSSIGTISQMMNVVTGQEVSSMIGSKRFVPSAGSHTFAIKVTVSAGTGQLNCAPTYPASLRISAVSSPIPIIPGASLPVAYGTTLPVSPVDGQEAILVDSLTNPSYQWRFRYNAGSSSAYKWEYIGGTRLGVEGVSSTTGSATYVDVASSLLTLPRAGDYLAEYGGDFFATAAGTYGQMSIKRGAATAADIDSVADSAPAASSASNSHSRITRVNGMAAGDVIRLQMKSNQATNATVRYGFLFLTPVRVA